MGCQSPDPLPPRALAALAAVGLVLADRFPEVAVPSLRRLASTHEIKNGTTQKPKGEKKK
jgi:hypothetical protein